MRCEILETKRNVPHLTSHNSHPFVIHLFRVIVAAFICGAMAVIPNMVWALVGDTESAFGLDGRLSTTNLLIDNYNFRPYFGNKSTDQTSQNIFKDDLFKKMAVNLISDNTDV